MTLNSDLKTLLNDNGANIVAFINIASFSKNQNQGFKNAVLFGLPLSPGYLQMITKSPGYVKTMVENKQMNQDEFHLKELKTDQLADTIAEYLRDKGYKAFSQSENNLSVTGLYNNTTKRTPLPHKTIARLAGIGWIGKHNLLVTKQYGSAISMCSVLTDAPLETSSPTPMESLCGNCSTCVDKCPEKVITGKLWQPGIDRDQLVDVHHCTTCLNCMVFCPFTRKYSNNQLARQSIQHI